MNAPGCRFRPLALCFQQVPEAESVGYSRRNREQSNLRPTAVLSTGSRRRNLQQPCSTRTGVTCRPSIRCASSATAIPRKKGPRQTTKAQRQEPNGIPRRDIQFGRTSARWAVERHAKFRTEA